MQLSGMNTKHLVEDKIHKGMTKPYSFVLLVTVKIYIYNSCGGGNKLFCFMSYYDPNIYQVSKNSFKSHIRRPLAKALADCSHICT